MSSLHFFVEPAITNEVFLNRLKEIGRGVSQNGFNVCDPFPLLAGAKVLEVAFASRHVALRLEGGRVCRVGFSISQEFADSVAQTQEKHNVLSADSQKQTEPSGDGQPPNKRMAGSSSNAGSHDSSGIGLGRQRLGNHSSAVAAASVSRLASAISGTGSSSGRSRALAANLVALGSRNLPPLPASMVPEALVQQVQTVLSGSKSRQLIIRELQRTHLDVNLAVNNLLSRDSDGEGDDDDDDLGDSSADPSEVVRLLDAAAASASGLVEHLLMDDDEDVQFVSRAAAHEHVRRAAAAAAFFDSSASQEENYSQNASSQQPSSKTPLSSTDCIGFDKELTFWLQEDGSPALFSSIGSMHTELVAVDVYGHLQAWPWRDAKPPPFSRESHGHPRARSLGLSASDRITMLACATSRASLLTESLRIATWIDSSIRHQQTAILEHCAMSFPQLSSMHIQKLCVSDMHSAVLTSAGSIYWWGALPYRMRFNRPQITTQPSNAPPTVRSGASSNTAPPVSRSSWESDNSTTVASYSLEAAKASIVPGATVRLRTSPLVSCGALAMGVPSSALPGVQVCPRLAELLEDAWNPTSSYRFKLLSPYNSSSSSSGQGLFSKRKRASGANQTSECNPSSQPSSVHYEEVCWPLSDVILLNDGPSPPLGRVVKVDGEYAAVRFNGGTATSNSSNNSPATQSDIESLLADCRLLRLSELEVVGATISTSNSCKKRPGAATSSVQMSPRRLDSLAEPGIILGWLLTADAPSPAVHILTRRSDGLYYRTVPLSVVRHSRKKSRHIQNRHQEANPGQLVHVPISACLFSDANAAFQLMAPSPANSSVLFATDQHCCVFPLCRPAVTSPTSASFCEAPFLRIGPMGAFAGGLAPNPRLSSSLPPTPSQQQSAFFVAVMTFQLPVLTTCIQRRDLAGVKRVLRYFERPDLAAELASLLESERSDGERNILHVAVEACAPLIASSSAFGSSGSGMSGQRRSSFDEPPDFDLPSFVDGSSSSRHRVTARRLTLRQMIREASSAAVNATTGGSGPGQSSRSSTGGNNNNNNNGNSNNNNNNSNNSGPTSGSSIQPWHIVLEKVGAPSATVTVAPAPTTSTAEDSNAVPSELFADLVQSLANPYSYVPSTIASSSSQSGDDLRRVSAQSASEAILTELLRSKALTPYLTKLLTAMDVNSRTPFMAAVVTRAYSAAIQLLHTVLGIVGEPAVKDEMQAEGDAPSVFSLKSLEAFIFPARHANADDNPFHMLCFNDTCSFTWTGAEHINQDIYECRSCGLVGSLCCCSECARVCHRGPGHDCRLKRTSPPSYCDCWGKCSCRGLLAGNQSDRLALAKELTKVAPQLVVLPTAAALGRPPESILSFLLRTLQRQQLEQRQYRGPPSRSSSMRSRSGAHAHPGYRSHQPEAVDPPRFVRQVLNFILDDPSLLGNIFICLGDTAVSPFGAARNNVSHVCELDRVAFLVLRCSSDVHDRFARALYELDQRGANEAVGTFVRSTVRAYSAIAACLPPNLALPSRSSSGSCGCIAALPLRGCRQLLAAVPLVAIRELASAAGAIIRPVTLGMCRGPSSAHNIISPMMVTSSVPEAVDAAETMLIGNHGASLSEFPSSSAQNRHDPSGAGAGEGGSRTSRFQAAAGMFGSRRAELPTIAADDEDTLDDDMDDGEVGSSSDDEDGAGGGYGRGMPGVSSGLPSGSAEFSNLPETMEDVGDEFGDDGSHRQNSGQVSAARSPSPLGVENYVDAEEYSAVIESGTNAAAVGDFITGARDQAIDLPPPLLPSVGPSSSASSVSGAASSTIAMHAPFAFAEPLSSVVQQDVTDAEQEQADETISLIRSAAATAGSEAGGTSLISYVSENEDDVDTISAAGSSVAQASRSNNQSTGGSRFRLRLQSTSSSSSSSSSSGSSDNSDEADVIRVMVASASDMDDALMERDALGGSGGVGGVDEVSTDSSSMGARAISTVTRNTAGVPSQQPPPPPPFPPPPPPPPINVTGLPVPQPTEPFRYHAGDIVLFGADMSPQQPAPASATANSRSGRFVTSSGGPIIDLTEMPLRTASPTIFHPAASLGAAGVSGMAGAASGSGHPASTLLSPHFNEMFQSANQQHLTRLFSILVRFAADLLSSLVANTTTSQHNLLGGSSFLNIRQSQPTTLSIAALRNLQDDVDNILEPALRWIVAAVDSIEAQLRCRASYQEAVQGQRHGLEGHFPRDPISSARLSFGHHALNLIRDPHGLLPNPDFLPALRHAIDSLLSLIRACAPASLAISTGLADVSSPGSSGSSRLIRASNRLLGYVEVSDDSDDSLPSSNASQVSSPTLIRCGPGASSDQYGRNVVPSSSLYGGVTYSAPPLLSSWQSARQDIDRLPPAPGSMPPVDPSHPFFRRSSSLMAVGWEAPPTFSTSAEEALPFALRPDMLNPTARRQELFGLRRQSGLASIGLLAEFPADPFSSVVPLPPIPIAATDLLPESAAIDGVGRGLRRPRVAGSELTEPLLAARWALVLNWVAALRPDGQGMDSTFSAGNDFPNMAGSDALLNFGRFMSPNFGVEGLGGGFGGMSSWTTSNTAAMISPVNELVGGYALVERRFRSDMERLRNSQQREIVLADLERSPSSSLLACVARQLQFAFSRRTGSTTSAATRPYLVHTSTTGCPPLLCHKLKVSFLHEPGEGAGVARSLFTTFAEAVTSEECRLPIPQLRAMMGGDHSQRTTSLSSGMQPSSSSASSSGLSGLMPPNAHGHSSSSSIRSSRGSNIFSQLIPTFFSVPISRGGSSSSSSRDWDRILRDAVAVSMLGNRSASFMPNSGAGDSSGSGDQSQLAASIPEFAPNHPDMQARFPSHKLRFGVRLLTRVSVIEPRLAGRIVYVLLHLSPNQLLQLLTSDSKLRDVVAETAMLITETQPTLLPSNVPEETASRSRCDNPNAAEQDLAPLFYRLSNGHLAPRVGRGSIERLVALRCVGRVIGLALLHAELCPLLLARHVIKYILGKAPFCFHDLAFLDPVAFDSLRRIALDVTTLPPLEAQKLFEAIDLTAVVDLLPEEGGGRVELNLPNGNPSAGNATPPSGGDASGGGNPVTPTNALAFVLAYAELRLVHAARPALDALRAGVLDVVPSHVLESLTPEDASLMLCGTGTTLCAEASSQQRVVDRLRALTTIQNESGRDADMVRRFKGWFWAEVSRLARQSGNSSSPSQTASGAASSSNGAGNSNALADLLSFWTGSSALPATDAALVSTPPSLVVRPPDDMHLPTANTCISRLYVPLYSSRLVLRRKLAIAIRTKMFGFV